MEEEKRLVISHSLCFSAPSRLSSLDHLCLTDGRQFSCCSSSSLPVSEDLPDWVQRIRMAN